MERITQPVLATVPIPPQDEEESYCCCLDFILNILRYLGRLFGCYNDPAPQPPPPLPHPSTTPRIPIVEKPLEFRIEIVPTPEPEPTPVPALKPPPTVTILPTPAPAVVPTPAPTPAAAPRPYRSPFPELPQGSPPFPPPRTKYKNFRPPTSRNVDQIGSFLDTTSLVAFSSTCRRTRWICQARLKMHFYLKHPDQREREIGPSLGLAVVYKEVTENNHHPRLIKITAFVKNPLYSTALWQAVLLDDGRPVGEIDISWLRPNDPPPHRKGDGTILHSPYSTDISGKCGQEGIYIKNLGAGPTKYSGVGTALMQAGGMEFGMIDGKKCDMRLFLEAWWVSHGFYWDLRMRIHNNENNQALVKKLVQVWKEEGKKRLKEDFGKHIMYLPPKDAAEWRRRIKQDPVLYETRNQQALESFKTELTSVLPKELHSVAYLVMAFWMEFSNDTPRLIMELKRFAEWRLRIKQDPVLYETRRLALQSANSK